MVGINLLLSINNNMPNMNLIKMFLDLNNKFNLLKDQGL